MTPLETIVVGILMAAVIFEPYRRARDRWTARRALRCGIVEFARFRDALRRVSSPQAR